MSFSKNENLIEILIIELEKFPTVSQIVKPHSTEFFLNIIFSRNILLISRNKTWKLILEVLGNVGVRIFLLNKVLESETHFALFDLYISGANMARHKWQTIGPINLPRHKIAESKISTSKEAKAVDIKGE